MAERGFLNGEFEFVAWGDFDVGIFHPVRDDDGIQRVFVWPVGAG